MDNPQADWPEAQFRAGMYSPSGRGLRRGGDAFLDADRHGGGEVIVWLGRVASPLSAATVGERPSRPDIYLCGPTRVGARTDVCDGAWSAGLRGGTPATVDGLNHPPGIGEAVQAFLDSGAAFAGDPRHVRDGQPRIPRQRRAYGKSNPTELPELAK
jgi:hypothetical protein